MASILSSINTWYWTTLTCIKSWPTTGEIDITEEANSAPSSSMALHTNAGCSISSTLMTSDCDMNAPGQATNAGYLIEYLSSQTFGNGFNAIGPAQQYPYISSLEMQFQQI
jgi:hypothetical protein